MDIVWTWDVVRRIIEVLWLINIAFAVWTVFRSRRDIASTWAWLLVLTILPVVGFILYLFVGRQLSHDEIFSIQDEQKQLRTKYLEKQRKLSEEHELMPKGSRLSRDRQLVNLFLSLNDSVVTFNNKVHVFIDGKKKFDKLIDDINHATDHVYIEYYSFYADNLGKRVLAALEDAAARGVKVRVLYDLSGSHGTTFKFFKHLEELGGEAQAFIAAAKAYFQTPRLNYHLHRKLAIIDGKIGYIGGFNIGDQYLGEDPKFGYWRDTHLRVVGQACGLRWTGIQPAEKLIKRKLTLKKNLRILNWLHQMAIQMRFQCKSYLLGRIMKIIRFDGDMNQLLVRHENMFIFNHPTLFQKIQCWKH